MTFAVAADSYDQFMGRFSMPLAALYVAQFAVHAEVRVLDVGCGTGAVTAELVARFGEQRVSAVDQSETFAARTAERFPAADVRLANAEQLPFDDATFDLAVAQLVINFLAEPVAGLREMARVTRRGGVVSASAWDFGTGRGPLAGFWSAARAFDPDVNDETFSMGTHEGELAELFRHAGLSEVRSTSLTVTIELADAEEWWHPFTFGVGPAGAYFTSLRPVERERLRARYFQDLPAGPFTMESTAWVVTGVVA